MESHIPSDWLKRKKHKIKISTDQVVSHTNTHQEGLPTIEGAIHYMQHRKGRGRETWDFLTKERKASSFKSVECVGTCVFSKAVPNYFYVSYFTYKLMSFEETWTTFRLIQCQKCWNFPHLLAFVFPIESTDALQFCGSYIYSLIIIFCWIELAIMSNSHT